MLLRTYFDWKWLLIMVCIICLSVIIALISFASVMFMVFKHGYFIEIF